MAGSNDHKKSHGQNGAGAAAGNFDSLPEDLQEALRQASQAADGNTDGSADAGSPEGKPPSVAETYELADAEPGADPAAQSIPTALATLHNENAELKEQLLRLAADLENFRKRARREQDDVRRFGIERLLGELLPVVDNLDRALEHATDTGNPVIEGVRMVARQFTDVLVAQGVVSFDSRGCTFDPAKHEAVSEAPGGGTAPGTILQELQRGYMIHTRLLRPARVVVAGA
jgi:molecular chaperone GrpE